MRPNIINKRNIIIKNKQKKEQMKVEELMSNDVVCIDMDERLAVVQELFAKHHFHHLLVIDKCNKLVAVISERDLLKAISPNIELPTANVKDLATLNKRVHQVVSGKVVCIHQFSSFSDAVKLFKEKNVSCLPVINTNNIPVGIITWRDVINWLYGKIKLPTKS